MKTETPEVSRRARRSFLVKCAVLAGFMLAAAVGGLVVTRKASADPKGPTPYDLSPMEIEAAKGLFRELDEAQRNIEERFNKNVLEGARARLVHEKGIDPKAPFRFWRDAKTGGCAWIVGESVAPVATSGVASVPSSG